MPDKSEEHNEVRWLLRQVRPFIGLYLFSLVCYVVICGLSLLDPLVIKWIIDDILPQRDLEMLAISAAAFFFIYFFRLSLNALASLLNSYAGQRSVFNIKLTLLRHLQTLSAEYHDKTPTGDLLFRVEQDSEQIEELGSGLLISLVRIGITFTLTLLIMFSLNWQLTLIILPLIPVLFLVRRYGYPRLRAISDAVQSCGGRRSSFLQEHLSALVQVQLLARECAEALRFVRLAREVIGAQMKRRYTELFFDTASVLVIVTATATVLGYGGYKVVQGSLTVGGLMAFYTYLNRVFEPLETVVSMYSKVQRANASIRRIMEVMAVRPRIRDKAKPVKLPRAAPGGIQLRNVSFAYGGEKSILKRTSLDVEPGERIAMVGASGSGKSTIARLMARVYDVDKGEVLFDGYDVRDIELKSLRSLIALVPQDPALFDVTLRENLLYGNPRATQAELDEVASQAQLEEILKKLPKGWDEPVGQKGNRLSGGERQRVAIARAMLQRPRLLILDESTSALDSRTEKRVLEALESFTRGRTMVIIAHRLSTILWADRILVIDRGRLVEEGSHNILYHACGVYRRLCNEQFGSEGNVWKGGGLPARADREVAVR